MDALEFVALVARMSTTEEDSTSDAKLALDTLIEMAREVEVK